MNAANVQALVHGLSMLTTLAAQYAEAQGAAKEAEELRVIAARTQAITERILAREQARATFTGTVGQ